MQVQVNTDHNIQGDERLAEVAESIVADGLGGLAGRLTRVEVHLRDENAGKGGGDDIRCALEARPEGLRPFGVSHSGEDVEAALRGAVRKLKTRLEHEFGKLSARE